MKRIDVLPDDVLLEIFDFYVGMSLSYPGKRGKRWFMCADDGEALFLNHHVA
jgi:hypothetical protein